MNAITLWTVQPLAFWDELNHKGCVLANESRVDSDDIYAYRWMNQQLNIRTVGAAVSSPIWFWESCHGRSRRKPDLRTSGFLAKNKKGVRLEVQLECDAVFIVTVRNVDLGAHEKVCSTELCRL